MVIDFRLKVFKTVADGLSFTKAAKELLISQPAVTKHISELEKQVGVKLLERTGNSVALTRHGALMLDYANRILALYGHLNDAFADHGKVTAGEIRIGASTTIAQYVLPRILAAFKRRYPDISVEMWTGNTDFIEEQVEDQRLELGLIEGKASKHNLHYETFMKDELVLVTSTSHSAFREEEINPDALQNLPLVIREAGSGTLDILEQALHHKGLSLRQMHIEMQLGSTEAIKRYLYHSEAFAFVSIQAVLDELTQHKLRVIEVTDFELPRNFSFVTTHGHPHRITDLLKQFCTRSYHLK